MNKILNNEINHIKEYFDNANILLFVKNMLYNKNIINNTEIIAIAFLFFNIKIPPFKFIIP